MYVLLHHGAYTVWPDLSNGRGVNFIVTAPFPYGSDTAELFIALSGFCFRWFGNIFCVLCTWRPNGLSCCSAPGALFLLSAGVVFIVGICFLFFLACDRPFLRTRKSETQAELAQDAALFPAPQLSSFEGVGASARRPTPGLLLARAPGFKRQPVAPSLGAGKMPALLEAAIRPFSRLRRNQGLRPIKFWNGA